MENASKAIIIAGAILLMLSIISIGVMIFGKGRVFVINMDEQLSQTDIDNHNSQFLRFEGKVSGAEVKNACTAVAQINERNKEFTMKIIVTGVAQFPSGDETQSKNQYNLIMNNVGNTQMYEGIITYNSDGIIDTLQFTRK